MIGSSFSGIWVTGVASAVPCHKVINESYAGLFGEATVKKIIASTGIHESYHVSEKQTASDLAYAAAQELMREKDISPQSIDILIFAANYIDYIVPPTSFVLQKRLGLSEDAIVYDMNLACSACIYGLQTVFSLLACSDAKRALLLIGDSTSKTVSPEDTSRLLFGDAGAALLVEKTGVPEDRAAFGLKSDGKRFKAIIIPAGGFRNPEGEHESVVWGDGNKRSDYHLYMNGMDVFSFAMKDVPELYHEFIQKYEISIDKIDAVVLHQPNVFILKHLAKKFGISMDKVPLSLDRYGNTSGASIPVTLCDAYGQAGEGAKSLLLGGFGVGLSWGFARLDISMDAVLPIVHSDEYYTDGGVERD